MNVDDGLIASTSTSMINNTIKVLEDNFFIKHNDLAYFIGFQIERSDDWISIHQAAYINSLLERFGMADRKPAKTPGDANVSLSEAMCPVSEDDKMMMTKVPYKEAVGALPS